MKLGFLMSYCRKNSVRDKVFGKKSMYLERSTLQRQMQSVSKDKNGFGRNTLRRTERGLSQKARGLEIWCG